MTRQKNHKAGAVDYSALSTPVGRPRGQWILWKPGLDPLALYKKSADFRAIEMRKNFLLGLAILGPLLTLSIAIIFISIGFQRSLGSGLFLIVTLLPGAALVVVWSVSTYHNRRRPNEYETINGWVAKNVGTLCITEVIAYDSQGHSRKTAEGRLVQAIAKIQLSQAIEQGWLDGKVLTEAHVLAWQTLIAMRGVTEPKRRQKAVNDAAQALEELGRHIDQLDQDLAARQDSEELQRLKSQYLDLRERTEAMTENVKVARKFLADHPGP